MRFIIVSGGVYSGVGKGVVAASLGLMLGERAVNIKWDGYYNLNAGILNPHEHGECFVAEDGAEVDLDFGHYERFTGRPARAAHSITRGKVNVRIGQLEQKNEGKTLQEIPHVRDLLVEMVLEAADGADVVVFEIGGTVGDDEVRLALHAAVALKKRFEVLHVHVVPLCYTIDGHEPKTKPVQRSLTELQHHGIFADLLVVRTERAGDLVRDKLADFVEAERVFEAPHLASVCALPAELARQGIVPLIRGHADSILPFRIQLAGLAASVPKIVIYGKYTGVADAYISIAEALSAYPARIELVAAGEAMPADVGGIIVPGGYGARGVEAKIEAIEYARTQRVPFLGICYGMQLAVVEFARNVCGLKGANTTEMDSATPHPVIHLLEEQRDIRQRSGTQRLGAHAIDFKAGTAIAAIYGAESARERYRHRYEVNTEYKARLEAAGLMVGATDRVMPELVAAVELPRHPFFVGVQFHPEYTATFRRAHPLFSAFVAAAARSVSLV